MTQLYVYLFGRVCALKLNGLDAYVSLTQVSGFGKTLIFTAPYFGHMGTMQHTIPQTERDKQLHRRIIKKERKRIEERKNETNKKKKKSAENEDHRLKKHN